MQTTYMYKYPTIVWQVWVNTLATQDSWDITDWQKRPGCKWIIYTPTNGLSYSLTNIQKWARRQIWVPFHAGLNGYIFCIRCMSITHRWHLLKVLGSTSSLWQKPHSCSLFLEASSGSWFWRSGATCIQTDRGGKERTLEREKEIGKENCYNHTIQQLSTFYEGFHTVNRTFHQLHI